MKEDKNFILFLPLILTSTTTTCGLWSRSGQNDWECLDIPELVSLFDYSGSAQATDDSSNSSAGGSESLIIF